MNYTSQMSSVSETSDELCINVINLKEEHKDFLRNCEQSENQCNSIDILPGCDQTDYMLNEAMEKKDNNSPGEAGREYNEMNMNDGISGDMHPDDPRERVINNKEIYIKTEYEVKNECVVKTEKEHMAEWENGTRYKAMDDVYNSTKNIIITEEIDIKPEPEDISEFPRYELECGAITNIENRDTWETCTSTTGDMSHYNSNTNIIIAEEIDIKPECGDDHEYEQSAVGQDTAGRISTSKPDESCASLAVKKCKEPTTTKSSHRIRSKTIHSGEKPFKCDQCDKTFYISAHLHNHKRVHSEKKPFKCAECEKVFTYSSSLFQHKRVHSGEKPFKCDECDKAFSNSSHLISHKRIHSGEKPLKCDQCDKSFAYSSCLYQHKRVHAGEKPFKCEQCGKSFSKSSNFINHKKIHTGEKPFKCDQCGKAFLRLEHLIRHKVIHSGDKPFKCSQCNKEFARSSCLTKHKRIHSREQPFRCDQCDKSFSKSSNLINHKKIHSGEVPFDCDQCDKAFSRLEHLIIHRVIHSGEKPFKCDQCHKAFARSSSLVRHKRTHS